MDHIHQYQPTLFSRFLYFVEKHTLKVFLFIGIPLLVAGGWFFYRDNIDVSGIFILFGSTTIVYGIISKNVMHIMDANSKNKAKIIDFSAFREKRNSANNVSATGISTAKNAKTHRNVS